MKITCSACHASYNLPDEKVAGRRVKVRCKRCSEPIVVDGSKVQSIPPPAEFEDEATRVMESPAGAPHMWTVNLSETEQGDMTDEEIVAGWQAGVVTEDAYVWRDGMDDWKPILEVPELVSLLSQATEGARPEPEPEPEPPPAPAPALAPALGSSPFGAPSPAKAPLPKPAPVSPSPGNASGDMFLNKPKPKREKPKYEASEARNENSMLFSLEALKAAAKTSEDAAPPKSVRVDENLLTLGLGGGAEMFNAPLIQVDAPAPQPVAKGISRAPVPAMTGAEMDFAPPKKGGKGWLVALGAVVVLGGGGFFAYSNLMPTDPAAAATSSLPAETAAPTAEETAAPEETATPEPSASEAPSAAPSSEAATSGKTTSSDKGSSSHGSSDRGSTTSGNGSGSESHGSEGSSSTPPSSGSDKKDDKDTDKDKDKEEAAAPPFNTDAARAALSAAASQAASCKTSDGPTGSGKVQVTFVPSGRVTSANVVSGPFGGTSVGGCIARTFRKARVPKFSGDAQIVAKSFKIP
jgi:predicted Zn finger-like uncharacterized protein